VNTEDPEILADRLRVMHAPRIFRYVSGRSLGDVWTLTQWLLRRSEETGKPAVLSRQLGPQPDGHDNVLELIPRIAALLDSTGTIEFTDEPGVDPPITGPSLWGPRVVYIPTKLKWHGTQDRLIAHQFNGRSGADAKNPPPGDVETIQRHLFFGGMTPLSVGLPWTVEQSVIILAACRQFIGVCSGLSHVAHSAGCPMILVRYRLRFERWHPDPNGPNPWVLAEGTDGAIQKLEEALQ
jgi:hypothetical protein